MVIHYTWVTKFHKSLTYPYEIANQLFGFNIYLINTEKQFNQFNASHRQNQ